MIVLSCREALFQFMQAVIELGSDALGGAARWTLEQLRQDWRSHPLTPFAFAAAAALALTASHARVEVRERTKADTSRPVVIGENPDDDQTRVPLAAWALGAEYFQYRLELRHLEDQIQWNRLWIRRVIAEQRLIYDIGISVNRTFRSPFYEAELKEISDAHYTRVVRLQWPG